MVFLSTFIEDARSNNHQIYIFKSAILDLPGHSHGTLYFSFENSPLLN